MLLDFHCNHVIAGHQRKVAELDAGRWGLIPGLGLSKRSTSFFIMFLGGKYPYGLSKLAAWRFIRLDPGKLASEFEPWSFPLVGVREPTRCV